MIVLAELGIPDATGKGVKHVRATSAFCQTSQNIGSTCTVTVTWPGNPFPDTNYTVVCMHESGQPANYADSKLFIPLNTRTTTSVGVTIETLNSLSAQINGLECIAMHD